MSDQHTPDRNPFTVTGRGPADGDWLEDQVELALIRWDYRTKRNVQIYGVEIDIAAYRRRPPDDPSDWLVVESKDWADRPITEDVIFRLATLAFTARAQPVLVTTTNLTDRAWRIAQAWDVRLLSLEDLQRETLPPLTRRRIPPTTDDEDADPLRASEVRGDIPFIYHRSGVDEVEAPVFADHTPAPCYVPDRTGNFLYSTGNPSR